MSAVAHRPFSLFHRCASPLSNSEELHTACFDANPSLVSTNARVSRPGKCRLSLRNVSPSKRKDNFVTRAKKDEKKPSISFGDQLLDYIEGGPKLRKWYGAPDQLPRDGKEKNTEDIEEEEDESDLNPESVLVTDGDSETGQLVVLSLILRRLPIKVIVKNKKTAMSSFGPYVQVIEGDIDDKKVVDQILRGVKSIIVTSKLGVLADSAKSRKVKHIVFLSEIGVSKDSSGLNNLFDQFGKKQKRQDESKIFNSGIPFTIIRTGQQKNVPALSSFKFGQGDSIPSGSITKEDLASVCSKALDYPPEGGLVFEVVNGDNAISNWKEVFDSFSYTSPLTSITNPVVNES